MRKTFSTHTPSELHVGYSRAVSVNNILYISGTTSQDERGTVIGSTLGEQTRFIFTKLQKVLEQAGFTLNDVTLLTVFVTDMKHLPEFDRVFKEFFGKSKPACTLVGVNMLVNPQFLVEIEGIAHKD